MGDLVRVGEGVDGVRGLQRGHGEWADAMLPVSSQLCCAVILILIMLSVTLSFYFSQITFQSLLF